MAHTILSLALCHYRSISLIRDIPCFVHIFGNEVHLGFSIEIVSRGGRPAPFPEKTERARPMKYSNSKAEYQPIELFNPQLSIDHCCTTAIVLHKRNNS